MGGRSQSHRAARVPRQRACSKPKRSLAASGLPATSLRLGGIYGPGRTRLIESVRSGRAAIRPGAPRFGNRIHRDDAAGALAHLIDAGARGSRARSALSRRRRRAERRGGGAALDRRRQLGVAEPPLRDDAEVGRAQRRSLRVEQALLERAAARERLRASATRASARATPRDRGYFTVIVIVSETSGGSNVHVILVREHEMELVLAGRQREARLGLAAAEVEVLVVLRDRRVERAAWARR